MKILSMYWNNIDPALVQAQADVFAHFGYDIIQEDRTGMDHFDWLTLKLRELPEGETVLFVDIDCVPTTRRAIEQAFAAAERGELYGVAQVANHIDKRHVYVSPVFLCISQETWVRIGSPDAKEDRVLGNDSGQNLTRAAEQAGITIRKLMPTGCFKPMWNLADDGFYGIGTCYETGLFHLFQSRKRRKVKWFLEICEKICNGEQLNWMKLYKRYSSWWRQLLPAR